MHGNYALDNLEVVWQILVSLCVKAKLDWRQKQMRQGHRFLTLILLVLRRGPTYFSRFPSIVSGLNLLECLFELSGKEEALVLLLHLLGWDGLNVYLIGAILANHVIQDQILTFFFLPFVDSGLRIRRKWGLAHLRDRLKQITCRSFEKRYTFSGLAKKWLFRVLWLLIFLV